MEKLGWTLWAENCTIEDGKLEGERTWVEPSTGYVYCIECQDWENGPASGEIERVSGGKSRILYYGVSAATTRRTRLGDLLAGTHSSRSALRAVEKALRFRHNSSPRLKVWFKEVGDQAELEETRLLNSYIADYGELPPANRKSEGALTPKVIRGLVDRMCDIVGHRRVAKTNHTFAAPERDPAAWLCNTVNDEGKLAETIGWVWTDQDIDSGVSPDQRSVLFVASITEGEDSPEGWDWLTKTRRKGRPADDPAWAGYRFGVAVKAEWIGEIAETWSLETYEAVLAKLKERKPTTLQQAIELCGDTE